MRNVARPLLLGFLLAACGCGFVRRSLARNLALPSQPATIAHKIRDPRRADARLSVLWLGHSTALVQMDDVFVLTDPVLTRTIGMLGRRLIEPGMDPEDLPPLAAVVVSHMHFDHLSLDSLAMIEHKTAVLLLPPGARSGVPRYACPSRELDRWQSYQARGLRVTAVPVRHVGGRFGLDLAWRPRSFTGYVFEYHGLSVYFGGDTAFDPQHFRAARERFPSLDAAVLPICPAKPHDFMNDVHMDPSEALQAFSLLGAKHMVPVHFDTFIASDDHSGDCPRLLHQAMRAQAVGDDRVAILGIGEQRVLVPR